MVGTGILSKGIKLLYANVGTEDFREIPDLQAIPDIGASAELVQVTTLADANHRYINGIRDFGSLDFTFLYDNTVESSSYRIMRGLEQAGLQYKFKIQLPDRSEFSFLGAVTTTITGVGVNDALTFTASIALNSNITVTDPV